MTKAETTFWRKRQYAFTPNVPQNNYHVHVVNTRTIEAKDEARTLEAKARTLKAKARTLKAKAKAKDMIFCPRGSSKPRPVLEDSITGLNIKSKFHRSLPQEIVTSESVNSFKIKVDPFFER